MDAKFYSGLFEGDSANGVKLSMGLTGGDFWARVGGCKNVYRGDGNSGADNIDFSKVLAVSDIESNAVGVTGIVHEAGASYLYAVRSVNCAGSEEQSPGSPERISFDDDGTIIGKTCNAVSDVKIKRTGSSKVRITWRYCPANQQAECMGFRIYSNGAGGVINYCQSIGTVDYTRSRVFSFLSDILEPGKWRFCVAAVTAAGYERMSGEIAVDIEPVPISDCGSIIETEVI